MSPAGSRTGFRKRRKSGHGADSASDRLLLLIAAERSVRSILLIAAGIVAVVHLNADWGRTLSHLARDVGLDPRQNAIGHLISRAGALSAKKKAEYGAVAIAYGLLEGVEAYGLWRRRLWAEYLTIVATALLLIPEVDTLLKRVTVLKAAGFVLNLVIVIFLIIRVRRKGRRQGQG